MVDFPIWQLILSLRINLHIEADRDEMADILQTTFAYAFALMQMYEFW